MATAAVQPQVGRGRRKSSAGVTAFLVAVVIAASVVLAIGFLSPTRLAMPQEYVLGAMHGGVATTHEAANVVCALPGENGASQAVTRFTRTITFHDGTTLVVVFDSSPAPTTLGCG